MKRLLFILACLLSATLSFSSFAKDCIGKICIGTTVIDSRNRVGKVDKFLENGNVRYSSLYYTYTNAPDALSPEIESLGLIKKNGVVVDQRNRVGKVEYVFEDGRVKYRTNYDRYVSRTVSPAVYNLGPIKKSSVVIDQRNRVGKVEYVFEDGRVQYKTSYDKYVSRAVSPEVTNLGLIKKYIMVVDQKNRVGKVEYVFKDGRVRYETYYDKYVSRAVSPAVTNLGLIKRNKFVIDQRDRVGKVEYVFEDGRVQYKTSYDKYVSKDVSPAVTNLGLIKKYGLVIDQKNRIGKVEYVFEDGRVRYETGYARYVSKNVSASVKEHDTYNKEDYYSDEKYNVGKVTAFFEDGRVAFTTTNGSRHGRTQLYTRVDSIKEYEEGTKIIMPTEHVGTVKMLFENGVVFYEVEMPIDTTMDKESNEVKKVEVASRIFGLNEESVEIDKYYWIYYLSQTLDLSTTSTFWRYYSSEVVIKESEYEALKGDLVECLENYPTELYISDKQKELIATFLVGTPVEISNIKYEADIAQGRGIISVEIFNTAADEIAPYPVTIELLYKGAVISSLSGIPLMPGENAVYTLGFKGIAPLYLIRDGVSFEVVLSQSVIKEHRQVTIISNDEDNDLVAAYVQMIQDDSIFPEWVRSSLSVIRSMLRNKNFAETKRGKKARNNYKKDPSKTIIGKLVAAKNAIEMTPEIEEEFHEMGQLLYSARKNLDQFLFAGKRVDYDKLLDQLSKTGRKEDLK